MDEERDIVVFEDNDGNELTMEVLDYLCYEGKEYALLTEFVEEESEACEACESESCEGCDNRQEAFVMEVRPVGEDQEEFVPVDEKMAEKLIEIFETSDFDEIYEDDED